MLNPNPAPQALQLEFLAMTMPATGFITHLFESVTPTQVLFLFLLHINKYKND